MQIICTAAMAFSCALALAGPVSDTDVQCIRQKTRKAVLVTSSGQALDAFTVKRCWAEPASNINTIRRRRPRPSMVSKP